MLSAIFDISVKLFDTMMPYFRWTKAFLIGTTGTLQTLLCNAIIQEFRRHNLTVIEYIGLSPNASQNITSTLEIAKERSRSKYSCFSTLPYGFPRKRPTSHKSDMYDNSNPNPYPFLLSELWDVGPFFNFFHCRT